MSAVAGQEYRCFAELDRERVAIVDDGRTAELSQHSFGCEGLRSWFLGDDDSDPEDRIGWNATAIPTGDPDWKP